MPEDNKQTLNQDELVDHGKQLVAWKFSEYVKYERSRAWYIGLGVIETLVIIYSIWTKNFLFALIVILVGIIVILHSRRQPMDLDCQIFEDGIQVGKKFYDWDDIKNFRIVYQPPQAKFLYIDLKNILLPDFSVPLNDQNPLALRDILKNYLIEELNRPYENITDRLNRWLKI